jgi:hypothetical protein
MATFPIARIATSVLVASPLAICFIGYAASPTSTSFAVAAEPITAAEPDCNCHPAQTLQIGVSAIDFLRAEAASREIALTKRIIIELIAKGYSGVPDWYELSHAIKKKILSKGYRDQDVGSVAEEAALEAGMRK